MAIIAVRWIAALAAAFLAGKLMSKKNAGYSGVAYRRHDSGTQRSSAYA